MIDVKIISKPKTTATGGTIATTGTAGAAYGQQTVKEAVHASEADHAALADEATHAAQADHATQADEATHAAQAAHAAEADEATHAASSANLDSDSPVWDRLRELFLSKTDDDTAAGLITFLKGIALGSDGKYGITSEGLATLAKTVTGVLETTGYTGAAMHDSGASIYEENGRAYTVTDYLTVRIKAIFAALEVRKLTYVGGNYGFSHAGSTIMTQEELRDTYDADGNALKPVTAVTDSSGNVTEYKCLYKNDDGSTRTMNMWETGDQALCQTFDISSPGTYENVSNRYYWRLVTATGTETVTCKKEDGTTEERQVGYVVLSNRDMFYGALTASDGSKVYAEGYDGSNEQTSVWIGRDPLTRGSASDGQQEQYRTAAATMLKYKNATSGFSNDTPAAGDVIVQAGCQTQGLVKERGGLVEIVTEGVGSEPVPAINVYASMNDYRWSKFKVIQISPDGIIGVAKYFSLRTDSTAGDPVPVLNYRGAYDSSVEFSYYDSVSYGGSQWLHIGAESTTGVAPGTDSTVWQLIVAGYNDSSDVEMRIYTDGDWFLDWGDSCTLTCKVMRGNLDLTSQVASWSVERDTGNSVNDTAWKQKDKVKNFAGVLLLVSGEDEDDLSATDKATFTFTSFDSTGAATAKKSITFV